MLEGVADSGIQHNYKVLLPQWRESFCQRQLFNLGNFICKLDHIHLFIDSHKHMKLPLPLNAVGVHFTNIKLYK